MRTIHTQHRQIHASREVSAHPPFPPCPLSLSPPSSCKPFDLQAVKWLAWEREGERPSATRLQIAGSCSTPVELPGRRGPPCRASPAFARGTPCLRQICASRALGAPTEEGAPRFARRPRVGAPNGAPPAGVPTSKTHCPRALALASLLRGAGSPEGLSRALQLKGLPKTHCLRALASASLLRGAGHPEG